MDGPLRGLNTPRTEPRAGPLPLPSTTTVTPTLKPRQDTPDGASISLWLPVRPYPENLAALDCVRTRGFLHQGA